MIVTRRRFSLRAMELESTKIEGLGNASTHPESCKYLMYCIRVNAGNRSMEWNAFYGPAITKIDYQSIITMNFIRLQT